MTALPHQLHALGTSTLKNFKFLADKLVQNNNPSYKPLKSRIVSEEQRFRLWAHSLGVHQTGHASLDYRLRDAVVVRDYTVDVLIDLNNHLEEVTSIVRGLRPPYEADNGGSQASSSDTTDDDESEAVADNEALSKRRESNESQRSKSSNASSQSSFDELDFRLKSIVERIDALFSLAVKIRNPANRPTRSTIELYKRVPADRRVKYMQEREQAEIAIIAYVQQQQLSEAFRDGDENANEVWEPKESSSGKTYYFNTITRKSQWPKPVELMTRRERILSTTQPWREYISKNAHVGDKYYHNFTTGESVWEMPKEYENAVKSGDMTLETALDTYAKPHCWLVRRIGVANARRKQQFVYWKEHAGMISKETPADPVPAIESLSLEQGPEVKSQAPVDRPNLRVDVQSEVAPEKSLATSATKLDPNTVKLDDTTSVISHQSRISTVVGLQGEKIEWPLPPTAVAKGKFFTCPHCQTLCPKSYLSKDSWRVHIVHDLQPYQCTYPDCADAHRLYGSRKEWLAHENQHRKVWRCALDEMEFETQPEYVAHVNEVHGDSSSDMAAPELVAASVSASNNTHRDCPLCPTAFSDVTQMQNHITHHLERLALFAFPATDDRGEEENDVSERSSDSNQAIRQKKGRQDSIIADFREKRLNLSENYGGGERTDRDPKPTGPLFEEIRVEPSFQINLDLDANVEGWIEDIKTEREPPAAPSWFTLSMPSENPQGDSSEPQERRRHAEATTPSTQLYFPDLPFVRDDNRRHPLEEE